jgi:hypothetical protein
MRLHFNLTDGSSVILDGEGIEVVDLDCAYGNVMTVLHELLQENPSVVRDWHGWRLDVNDPFEAVAFSVNLQSMALLLRYCGSPDQ